MADYAFCVVCLKGYKMINVLFSVFFTGMSAVFVYIGNKI